MELLTIEMTDSKIREKQKKKKKIWHEPLKQGREIAREMTVSQ